MQPAVLLPRDIQLRLTIFRRTLTCLMDKVVLAGGEECVAPEVAYQINQTRRELDFLERKLADVQRTRSIA